MQVQLFLLVARRDKRGGNDGSYHSVPVPDDVYTGQKHPVVW